MNTEHSEQEFNSMFDELLDDVVRGSGEAEQSQERYSADETENEDYVNQLVSLIEDLLMEQEYPEQEEPEQEEPEQEEPEYEHQFTMIMGTRNEEMISRFERATNQLLLELVEPEQVDVVIFHLLSEREQERVINHNVAWLSSEDLQSIAQDIENMRSENEEHGISVEQYLQQDLSEGIPFEEDGVSELAQELEEREQDDELDNMDEIERSIVNLIREQDEPEEDEPEEDEPAEGDPVEDEPEEEEQQPVRRRRSSRGNDYTLAWDIYSLGYAAGDIAHIYDLSAGSITRGMKDLGHEMRTSAETRAMIKADPDEFSEELLDRIFSLLDEKYESEEERNTAFYHTFNKNIYELTLYEAEDESLELQEMVEQASNRGLTLQEYVRQGLDEEVYEERGRSEFLNNVRYLHETVKDKAREIFGDVNVDVGSVDVESKVSYENGVILTVKEAYKLDGKALDVSNVVFGVQIAEFIVQSFEREIEELIATIGRITNLRFDNHSQVTRLGNRLVVGLDNE